MNNTPEHLFFWNGPFSQWHRAYFTVDGVQFNCAEQYTMYSKAKLFANNDIANQILATNNPKEHKKLGRAVKGFDMVYWNENCIQIVFRGNHAKFSQNKRLYDMLMNTNPSQLVEASPYDNVWGIGLNEEDAKKTDPSKWPGKNWLGKTLDELREFFLEEERITREDKNGRT